MGNKTSCATAIHQASLSQSRDESNVPKAIKLQVKYRIQDGELWVQSRAGRRPQVSLQARGESCGESSGLGTARRREAAPAQGVDRQR